MSWNADGTFSYVLDRDNSVVQALLVGDWIADTFEYAVTDGTLSSTETLTVTINGFNDAPVAIDDLVSLDLRTQPVLDATVLANDQQIDDAFTLSAVEGSAANIGAAFELPSGARLMVNADGTFTYDPNGQFDDLAAGANREDTFEYTITDAIGKLDTATATITVTGKNDAPTAITLSNQSILSDASTDFAVIGRLSTVDIDLGDSHTYSIDASTSVGGRLAIQGNRLVISAGMAVPADDYLVRLMTTDAGGLTTDGYFVVTVDPQPIDPTLTIDLAATGSTDLTVRRDGGDLQVIDNTSSTTLITQSLAATESLTIVGSDGVSESVTIDYGIGDFFDLPANIVFSAGADGNDRLTIIGDDAITRAKYVSQDLGLGNARVELQEAGETTSVSFSGVEPLDIHGMSHIQLEGIVNVGNQTLSLESVGLIDLDTRTQLSGGTIQAIGLLPLGIGETLTGNGTVAGRFAGQIASSIVATGDLTIGDAAAADGFTTDGLLKVDEHTVTLDDANQAVLGSLTTLGSAGNPGTLNAGNVFLLSAGRNVTGHGTIDSPNTLAERSVVDGAINGNSSSEEIVLTGYIKGNGSLNHVRFDGTHSPGSSPAILTAGSFAYGDDADLILEIGGTTPGSSGHDQMVSSGTVQLDGDLDVALINSFDPQAGDSFVLMTASDGFTGDFDNVTLPVAPLGSDWHLTNDGNELRLTLVDLADINAVIMSDGFNETQRSNITEVKVQFDGLVDVDAGAFVLTRLGIGGGVVTTSFTLSNDGQGNTVATLTFSGDQTRGSDNALLDGNFRMLVDADKVRVAGTPIRLDGDGDGLQGGLYEIGSDRNDAFFAQFGDVDGDRDVDVLDYGLIAQTFGQSTGDANYDDTFDFDGDGDVDGIDFAEFRRRLNGSV